MSKEKKVVYTCTLDELIQVFEKSPFFKNKSRDETIKYMRQEARNIQGPYYDFGFCQGTTCNTFRITHDKLFGTQGQ